MFAARTATMMAAACSVASCCGTLLCLAAFPKWRNSPSSVKHVLFSLTLFDLMAGLNYTLPKDNVCILQAVIMQFFEIGSWLWSVILSVDLARELYTTLTKFSLPRRGGSIFEIKKHLIGYHAFVLGFSTITTILLVPVLKLNGDTGAWCWTNNKQWQLFTYVVLWIGFVVIMASMALINWLVSRAQAALVEREYRGVVSSRTSSRNRRRWALLQRLLIVPTFYVLLHVPGTIRRVGRSTGCAWCTESYTLAYFQGCCDPSQGSANFILFVVIDKSLQKEVRSWWAKVRCNMCWSSTQRSTVLAAAGEFSETSVEDESDGTDDDGGEEDYDLPEEERFSFTDAQGRSTLFKSRLLSLQGAGSSGENHTSL